MQLHSVYFSPTHTTKKIAQTITEELSKYIHGEVNEVDWTRPEAREKELPLERGDWLLLVLPVYEGRIPELLEEKLEALSGYNTPTFVVAVYGNRDYEDALLEMATLLEVRSFKILGAATFVAEHSYTSKLATGRPDADDLEAAKDFATKCSENIKVSRTGQLIEMNIPGDYPPQERRELPNISPSTSDDCIDCKLCAEVCPMGAVDYDDTSIIDNEKCIQCNACVKFCPVEAKYFDEPGVKKIIGWLEKNFTERKEPEFFGF